MLIVIPVIPLGGIRDFLDIGTPIYWIFQFGDELCVILSLVIFAIFLCQLTFLSAKNLWIMFFVMCTAADLGIIVCLMLFPEYNSIFQDVYYITGVLYYIGFLGLSSGLFFPIFWHMYRYTREKVALLLCIAVFILISADFSGIFDYTGLALQVPLPDWWQSLRGITTGISFIADFFIWGTFLIKRDYIYRLPFDVHMLLVMYRDSGLTTYEARFTAQHPIHIEGSLLAGFFTALNSVFEEVGRKEVSLEGVVGSGLHFILEWGKKIVTLVVTDQDTYYLRQAVKFFTRDFETCYEAKLEACTTEMGSFNQAADLIKKNFPFFKIIEEKNGGPK